MRNEYLPLIAGATALLVAAAACGGASNSSLETADSLGPISFGWEGAPDIGDWTARANPRGRCWEHLRDYVQNDLLKTGLGYDVYPSRSKGLFSIVRTRPCSTQALGKPHNVTNKEWDDPKCNVVEKFWVTVKVDGQGVNNCDYPIQVVGNLFWMLGNKADSFGDDQTELLKSDWIEACRGCSSY